jgi:hypothetical protein
MFWRRRMRRVSAVIAAPVLALSIAATAGATVRCVSANPIPYGQARQYACKPPLYSTISSALAASSAGDTIYVFNGTYAESVSIPSALTGLSLIGVAWKGGNPAINAAGLTNGIFDQASDVTIEGFTVKNAQHEGILVEGPPANCVASTPPAPPVCTPGAAEITNVTISYNVISNNDLALVVGSSNTCSGAPDFEQDDCGEGLHLDGVAFSTVSYNQVSGNSGGILDTDETNPNHDNLISYNSVTNNAYDCGITLPSHPPNGAGANAGTAFGVYHDSIVNNLSANNLDAGIGIFAPTPGNASYNHLIAGNRIFGNGNPGITYHAHAANTNLNGTTIVNNMIEDNGPDPEPGAPDEGAGPAGPTGIELFAGAGTGAPPIDARIEGNTITGETNDIWVGAAGWSDCSALGLTIPCYAVSANLNNLLGGKVGVNNAGDLSNVIVNASDDFWGCRGGPGSNYCTSIIGNVLTNPFLPYPAFPLGATLP